MNPPVFHDVVPLPPFRYAETWLVGARTHAMYLGGRQVELIRQPSLENPGGTLELTLAAGPATKPAPRLRARRRLAAMVSPPPPTDLGEGVFFDTRADDYFNWSHQVNKYLTVALCARGRIGLPVTVLLPANMAGTAVDLYRHFGFETLSSDGPVTGRELRWQLSSEAALASARRHLVAAYLAAHDRDENRFPTFPDLPSKVLLARRGGRKVANEAEIGALLATRGYHKVYAEELSVVRQFALLRQATHVVATHGAALAPLEYRSPSAPPLKFVELFPVGHMTRFYELQCHQAGGHYCAVRGQLKRAYLPSVYQDGGLFDRFSQDAFVVDPYSVRVALHILDKGGLDDGNPSDWPLAD